MDERGQLEIDPGQTFVDVVFLVPKINANYHFEYLYVSAPNNNTGAIQAIAAHQSSTGFRVLFAGTPVLEGRILNWRVVIASTSTLVQVGASEDLYVNVPISSTTMTVNFVNPRGQLNYGFTELRVENLIDPPSGQAVIRVQVVSKLENSFTLAINPMAPTSNYFLRVRTP